MIGRITDCRVKIKPSQKLIDFILTLHDEQIMPENILKLIQSNLKDFNAIEKEILQSSVDLKKLTNEQLQFLHDLELNENDYKETNTNLKNLFKSYDNQNEKTNEVCSNKLKDNNADADDDDNDDDNVEGMTNEKNSKEQINLKSSNHDNTNENSSDDEQDDDNDENDKEDEDNVTNNANKVDNKNNILHLELNDLKWIKQCADKRRELQPNIVYLYELLENSELIMPENEIIPRNPELEKRCIRLRAELAAKQYREMTKNVDTTRKDAPEDKIGYQLKAINRQLIAVLQFIFSVIAGFAFGFLGVELIIGNLDFGFRLLLGVMCALIIALAEIYFLAKKLNEYDEIYDGT